MKVSITEMHCDACVRRVERALATVEGATVEKVAVGSAVVKVDATRETAVLDAIRNAGYEASKAV